MKRTGEIVAAALLMTAGCMTCPHPDSDGWEDVFNKDLSNATCAKPGWAWDKDGYLVPDSDFFDFIIPAQRLFGVDSGT